MRARLWIYGIVLVAIAGLLGLTYSPAETGVFGRNGGILNCCQCYVSAVLAEASDCATEDPNRSFLITSVSQQTSEYFAQMATSLPDWKPKPHLLVSIQPLTGTELPALKDLKNRRILIVCDTPYTKTSSRYHPKHAVGYSDGSIGLITPAEFATLDLSTFKRLDELFPEPTPYPN